MANRVCGKQGLGQTGLGQTTRADLIALRDCGAALDGAISGRALYDGKLDLAQALAAVAA
jgi:phosphoribosylformimino-5-aminoimidazole carboxamide ribotide isomerase